MSTITKPFKTKLADHLMVKILNDLNAIWSCDFDHMDIYMDLFQAYLKHWGFTNLLAWNEVDQLEDFEPWQDLKNQENSVSNWLNNQGCKDEKFKSDMAAYLKYLLVNHYNNEFTIKPY